MARSMAAALLLLVSLLAATSPSSAVRPRSLYLVATPTPVLNYHNGALLTGRRAVHVLYYGRFTASQRSILSDFILSLSSPATSSAPSPASWWATTTKYHPSAAALYLGRQVLDESLSRGGSLNSTDLAALADRLTPHKDSIALIVTAPDILVDGFCVSRCGHHDSAATGRHGRVKYPYIWVGDASSQCAGECAWPFQRPVYGPQAPPLPPPNGDVGMDGVVITAATLLAGAVTNPYGDGFFEGDVEAPLEAVTACTGMFGAGAYPGNPGNVLTDSVTGGGYNAVGAGGRKFLLPAMWDPKLQACSPLV